MATTITRRNLDPFWRQNAAVQQCGHMLGSALVFDAENDIALIKDQAGNSTIAKAVESSSAGNLEVHMVDDWDANGNPVWRVKALEAGVVKAMIIDAVRETNQMVVLADLEIHL